MHQVVQEIKSKFVSQKRSIKRFFEETISDSIANGNGSIKDCVEYARKLKDFKSHLYKIRHEQPKKKNATIEGIRFLLAQTENDIMPKTILSSLHNPCVAVRRNACWGICSS